jgi:hypothetical protein
VSVRKSVDVYDRKKKVAYLDLIGTYIFYFININSHHFLQGKKYKEELVKSKL